uniref:Akirin n=1 Tax=Angiostrongylus cantonensis TaxID=6313 RepID=A0A158PAX6_ANGCA
MWGSAVVNHMRLRTAILPRWKTGEKAVFFSRSRRSCNYHSDFHLSVCAVEAFDLCSEFRLHQSSENLRKSSDNLGLPSTGENEKEPMRTRSISSLKGGNSLEAYGTFDVDQHQNVSSLTHSRLLARSAGNVSLLGRDKDETPASRLQNTIDMLKKARRVHSTPPCCGSKKKLMKYLIAFTNLEESARNQTSEESDSNGSDASPLNQTISRRLVSSNNRCVYSSTIYVRKVFSGAVWLLRVSIPIVFSEDMVGPDLGSDDSPRSSLNSYEWNALLEEGAACQQLVRHVQDCYEQLQVNVDKAVQARMLVR